MDENIKYVVHRERFSDENDLMHFGVKGMHWGIRRYQNKDGSLTAAGRKKYGEGPPQDKKTFKEKREARKKEKAKKAAAAERQKKLAEHEKKMRTSLGATSGALEMTPKQLEKETARYKAAADYMDQRSRIDKYIDQYTPKTKSTGEKMVDAFSKAASVADSIGKIKGAYDKVFGTPQTQSDFDKYKTELQRLAMIEKKKNLNIDDKDTQWLAKNQKKSVNDIVKTANQKIDSMNQNGDSNGSNKKKNKGSSSTSNAEKMAEVVKVVLTTTNNYYSTSPSSGRNTSEYIDATEYEDGKYR